MIYIVYWCISLRLNWNDITASSRYKIQNVCITLLNQVRVL